MANFSIGATVLVRARGLLYNFTSTGLQVFPDTVYYI